MTLSLRGGTVVDGHFGVVEEDPWSGLTVHGAVQCRGKGVAGQQVRALTLAPWIPAPRFRGDELHGNDGR